MESEIIIGALEALTWVGWYVSPQLETTTKMEATETKSRKTKTERERER